MAEGKVGDRSPGTVRARDGAERRQYPRLPRRFTAHYSLTAGRKEVRGKATGMDLSAAGMRLRLGGLAPPVMKGIQRKTIRRLELRFKLVSEREPIEVLSEVRWAKPLDGDVLVLGVRFLDLNEDNTGKILRYVISRLVEAGL